VPKPVSANQRPRWATLAKSALGVAVAWGALNAGHAQALVVNVFGQDYEVTTFTGSKNSNSSKFDTPANGGEMPWWNDDWLAAEFANAVGTQLGLPNQTQFFGDFSPYFARGINGAFTNEINLYRVDGTFLSDTIVSDSDSYVWAKAQAVATPTPGPLPIFGAAAAFGASRQLRKRINASKGDRSRAASL
jgi:hypothetical protein